ncbi:GNAT family N-acetyltransferase [Terrisporobacter sp.]|uniref:GNAT family N-acetyltransferase n=1 Tax=Terrisporobacter sp. TaxID=1965305 RepID=UPI002609CAFF|nr:GNAT family N-acetyltransferase [Terrisporobacter sp.]
MYDSKYTHIKILVTKRTILRPIMIEDAQDLFEYYSNGKVLKYIPIKTHKNIQETKKFISTYFIDNYNKKKYSHYAIVYKNNKKVIGNIGFNNISPNSSEGEIGICINPNYWGLNLSTELLGTILKYGFYDLNLDKIYAVVYDDNKYSKSPLLKYNFEFSHEFTKRFASLNNKHIKCQKYFLSREIYLNKNNKG